jgi:hypothetical protein
MDACSLYVNENDRLHSRDNMVHFLPVVTSVTWGIHPTVRSDFHSGMSTNLDRGGPQRNEKVSN